MRILTWIIRLFLFVMLLAFAARNTDPVTLRFYFDLAWRAPLIALLLVFFAVGAALGVAAVLGVVLRQRRQIQQLRLARPADNPPVPRDPPPPDVAAPPRSVDG